MSRKKFHFLFWSFLSLGIHFLYFLGVEFIPAEWTENNKTLAKNDTVEIQIVNSEKKDPTAQNQQIVRQTQTDETYLADSKEKARFKSEKDQRVLLETRAREVGLSKNRTEEAHFLKTAREQKQKRAQQNQNRAPIKLSQTGIDYSEYKALDVRKEIQDVGSSTVGDSLPLDVTVGSFTALNTDRFTFYTFYSRIEELVRFRWETKVSEAINSFNRNFLTNQVMTKNWATEVEFLLTPKGEFYKAKLLGASGIPKFDQATIWAFRDARVFPNPPQEMVQEDGYIHLHYTFNVYLNPSAMAEK